MINKGKCEYCGESLFGHKSNARFCSPSCRGCWHYHNNKSKSKKESLVPLNEGQKSNSLNEEVLLSHSEMTGKGNK